MHILWVCNYIACLSGETSRHGSNVNTCFTNSIFKFQIKPDHQIKVKQKLRKFSSIILNLICQLKWMVFIERGLTFYLGDIFEVNRRLTAKKSGCVTFHFHCICTMNFLSRLIKNRSSEKRKEFCDFCSRKIWKTQTSWKSSCFRIFKKPSDLITFLNVLWLQRLGNVDRRRFYTWNCSLIDAQL